VTAVQVVELRALETRLQHLHLKEIMAQLEPLVVAIMLQAVVVVLVRQDQQQAMLL
jgi:chromate transport protein ChrA